MGNKSVNKVYIDSNKFNSILKQHDCNIRRLGNPSNKFYCGYHERTFRRAIKIGYMSFDVFRAINSKIDISECVIKDENSEIVNMYVDNLKLKQELKSIKILLKDLLIKIDVLERELQID